MVMLNPIEEIGDAMWNIALPKNIWTILNRFLSDM